MSGLDQAALKAQLEALAEPYSSISPSAAAGIATKALAALEEAERAKSDLFDEAIRQKRRANDAERRLAAVREWRDEHQAHEVYEATENEPEECTDECEWCLLDAALHPVAETTERME